MIFENQGLEKVSFSELMVYDKKDKAQIASLKISDSTSYAVSVADTALLQNLVGVTDSSKRCLSGTLS